MTSEYDIVTNTQPYAEDLGLDTADNEPAKADGQPDSVTRAVMPMAPVKLLDAAKRVISLHDRQLLTCVPHDSTAIESLRVAAEEFREMLQREGTKPNSEPSA